MNRRSFLSRFFGGIASVAILARIELVENKPISQVGGIKWFLEQWEAGSSRRKIFYDYPNGAAPLTGMLDGIYTSKFIFQERE